MEQSVTVVEKKSGREIAFPRLLRNMTHLAALCEQTERTNTAEWESIINRLWGIMQSTTGGTLFNLVMNSPSLSDGDKQFVKYTKGLGAKVKPGKKSIKEAYGGNYGGANS